MDNHLGRKGGPLRLEVLGEQRQGHSEQSTRAGIENVEKLFLAAQVASVIEVQQEAGQEQHERHRHRKAPETLSELFNKGM